MPSFEAGAQLLSSLSGYAYTKKAWRKEVFELFMDPLFFTMDASCAPKLVCLSVGEKFSYRSIFCSILNSMNCSSPMPNFFCLTSHVVYRWKSIIDHLLTHEKTMFKDLMSEYSLQEIFCGPVKVQLSSKCDSYSVTWNVEVK